MKKSQIDVGLLSKVWKENVLFKTKPSVIKLWGGLPQSNIPKAHDDFGT